MKNLLYKILGFFIPSFRSTGAGVRQNEIDFMDERNAAIYHTGHSFAYILSLAIFLLLATFILWPTMQSSMRSHEEAAKSFHHNAFK